MKPFYNNKNIVLYNENTFDVLDLLIKQIKRLNLTARMLKSSLVKGRKKS